VTFAESAVSDRSESSKEELIQLDPERKKFKQSLLDLNPESSTLTSVNQSILAFFEKFDTYSDTDYEIFHKIVEKAIRVAAIKLIEKNVKSIMITLNST
jgi:hypothetical protein